MVAVVLGPRFKSFPPAQWGMPLADFVAQRHALDEFATPLLTIDATALAHNVDKMATWSAARGIGLAPHGKTTMAPALWNQVLQAGAWGLTLATPWQVQVARSFGVARILVANEFVDPVALSWLAEELHAHEEFEFYCWADSTAAVAAMDAVLSESGLGPRVGVLVELGADGGRTGARTLDAALEVASAIAGSACLHLAGVGGYEGALAHDRSPEKVRAVAGYLDKLVELHRRIEAGPGYRGRAPIVTAGGSAYFDLVADRLAPLVGSATILLRSGAYQVHDDGFYGEISPFAHAGRHEQFHAAMHGWARVLSRPERREFDRVESQDNRVIVAGFGRVGQIVGRVLRMRRIAFTALESSVEQVDVVRRFGTKVYYGDASRLEVLQAAGAARAEVFVLAVEDVEASVRTAELVRRHFPHLKIIARARNRQHAIRLMDLGVRYLIRETYLSSLDLAQHTLEALGLARTDAVESIRRFDVHDQKQLQIQREIRDDEQKLLQSTQQAARELEQLFESDTETVTKSDEVTRVTG